MMRTALLCSVITVALAACTQFPDLDATQTDALNGTAYPPLLPLEPLLARADTPGSDPVQTQAELTSRLASLRARAGAMRGSVLTGAEKQRLEEGLR